MNPKKRETQQEVPQPACFQCPPFPLPSILHGRGCVLDSICGFIAATLRQAGRLIGRELLLSNAIVLETRVVQPAKTKGLVVLNVTAHAHHCHQQQRAHEAEVGLPNMGDVRLGEAPETAQLTVRFLVRTALDKQHDCRREKGGVY